MQGLRFEVHHRPAKQIGNIAIGEHTHINAFHPSGNYAGSIRFSHSPPRVSGVDVAKGSENKGVEAALMGHLQSLPTTPRIPQDEVNRNLNRHQFPTTSFGMVSTQKLPRDVREAHDYFGAGSHADDEDGLLQAMGRHHVITPTTPIRTGQTFLREDPKDPHFRDSGGSDVRSAVRVYTDAKNRDWLLDGHHRLASARLRGQSIPAVRVTHDDLKEAKSWEDG